MTRKKNISKTWQANLLKQPPKHTPVSRKPTIDDVMDSELESDFDFKDSEVESEEEMGSDDEDITLKEIQSDAELLEFATRLQESHDWMVTEEKAKRADKKRKCTYSGDLDRSKWRWQLQGQRVEEAGFPSVTKFFLKQTEPPKTPRTLESQAEEHIQNAQQDKDPEVDIFCWKPHLLRMTMI
ncbi:hypothetical protein L208DRAFT_1379053 [Tricholoma matsutake]|nr:hypothetical protein L208DRAFT_1379053 [Tricholoma matsutake 945]